MNDIITIRASSLPELFDCPARWESKYVYKRFLPRSGAAQVGTAIHKSTAVYDCSTLNGTYLTLDDAAGAAVDAIHHPEEDISWDDITRQQAESIALALHSRYCKEIAPNQNYIGVEVTCTKLEITDLGLALTGTTDRIAEHEHKGLGIVDLKSGKTAVNAQGQVKTAGHLGQVGVYELLTSQELGQKITAPAQIIGMQTGKTAAGQRVAVAEIHNASDILIGDEEQPGLLELASKVLHSGLFFGNPKSQLCNVKYCPAYGTCRFRG